MSKKTKKNKNDKSDINKESETTTIMDYDIVANENAINDSHSIVNYQDTMMMQEMSWLTNLLGPKENNDLTQNKYKLFMECCNLLENETIKISDERELKEDPHYNKLYMYFVSLEQDKLFLHADFKMNDDEVVVKCESSYEYVKKYKPRKIVFTIEIQDLYDVDKYVKTFMHMFGIDDTRGGSYTEIDLPQSFIETINHEKKITTLDYYVKKK